MDLLINAETKCTDLVVCAFNDEPKNLIEIAKDAIIIKNKVEEDGVGYLKFCSVKQIKSMCLAAKILKSSFECSDTSYFTFNLICY